MGNNSEKTEQENQLRAMEYVVKLLDVEKDVSSFSSVIETSTGIDAKRAEAICILGDNACLKKVSFDVVVAAGADAAVVTAKEIVNGLQNLKKLEKVGMNTSRNHSAVILAGEKATEKSLELWEKRKVELQAAARKSEHSSLYNNPAARSAARAQVSEKLQKIEADAGLNRPVKVKAEAGSRRPSAGG